MPRQRSSWRKSTNGCNQCKASHVKCDEQHPCHRCTRLGRECSYERQVVTRPKPKNLQFQFDLVQLPARFALPAFTGSERDLRAFQFFLEETVPILDKQFSIHFWTDTLLSAQSSHSALHYACLAVGSLHRTLMNVPDADHGSPDSSPSTSSNEDVSDAQWLYIQALRKSRQAIESGTVGPTAMKLTSILLALYSSMQGRSEETKAHMRGGLQLVSPSMGAITNLEQYNTDGVLFSYRFLSLIASGEMQIYSQAAPEKDLWYEPAPTPTNVRDARGALHDLLRLSMVFTYHERKGSFESIIEQEKARADIHLAFQQWKDTIKPLEQLASAEDDIGFALLDAQYEFSRSRLDVHETVKGPKSGPNLASLSLMVASIQRFIYLFHQSSTPSGRVFLFQTGVIPMLLYAAKESANADLQRQILALLSHVPETEGLWNTTGAIEAVEKMLAGDPTGDLKVPGWCLDSL